MIFTRTQLDGVVTVDVEQVEDSRGAFARTFCKKEFERAGLPIEFLQFSTSFNLKAGTLRGLHYQAAPFEEDKLVRCTRGAIFDVALDVRPKSSTFGKWFGTELTADNRRALFIPKGYAHGFQTLLDNTEVFYQISVEYQPGSGRGVRWNDSVCNILWPLPSPMLSEKDASYPDFNYSKGL